MFSQPVEILLTLATIIAVIACFALTRFSPEFVLMAGLVFLMLFQVVSPQEALAGFSNQGMLTVAVLFIVVAGLRETGGVSMLVQRLLGRPRTTRRAQIQLMAPVTLMSAFLNNTTVVAMLVPAVNDWAKRNRLSTSHLMIPLSYAAILGGTCTIIGTSTNLVVNGLILEHESIPPFEMFDIAWVGIPCALLGIVYILFFSPWLLPNRKPIMESMQDTREYTIEMIVEPNSPLAGSTIEQAGLRHLPGMFLMEIERSGHVLPAVSPHEVLQADDRLVFVGVVESVVDLHKIRGLTPATDQVFKLNAPRPDRCLIETVVSHSCPLVGKTIKEGRFRTVYDAVVIAVARNGERINKKIGDIELCAGDTLLLESDPSFYDRMRSSSDFYLVNRIEDSNPPRHEKAYVAISILALMVFLASFNVLSMFKAASLAAVLMLVFGCCSSNAARKSLDLQVILVIAAAISLGRALEVSGTAAFIVTTIIQFAGDNPLIMLALIYLVTTSFTEIATNNAAAVLVFPIAYEASHMLEVNFAPFVIAIMMGASASFSTPIGYQTNLMVYGPGGYRFTDYARIGPPLNIMVGIVTIFIAPIVWPF